MMRSRMMFALMALAASSGADANDKTYFVQIGQKTVDGRLAPIWAPESAEARTRYKKEFERVCSQDARTGDEKDLQRGACFLYSKLEMEDKGYPKEEQLSIMCRSGWEVACAQNVPGPFLADRETLQLAYDKVALKVAPPAPFRSSPVSAQVAVSAPADDGVFRAAKSAVSKALRDPDSARFDDAMVRAQRPNVRGELVDVVCGRVNARNGFGGYSGMSGFVYFVSDGRVTLASSRTLGDLEATIYHRFCG